GASPGANDKEQGQTPLPAPRSVFTRTRAEKPEFTGASTGMASPPMPSQTPSDSFDPMRARAGRAAPNPEAAKSVPVTIPAKVGRNDPCPCGSGKKYKKCCGE